MGFGGRIDKQGNIATSSNIQPATPEMVWAILRDLAERQVETEKKFEQLWLQSKETDKQLDKVG